MSDEQINRDPRHYLLFLAVTGKKFCKTILKSSETDLTSVLKRQFWKDLFCYWQFAITIMINFWTELQYWLNSKQALEFLEVTDAHNHLG